MLTPEETARMKQLEAELGLAPKEILTKPTEESFLRKAIRKVSQLPRGILKGGAELADIPYAVGHLAVKRELPKESLSEKLTDLADRYATWSAPGDFTDRAAQNLVADLMGGRGIHKLGKGLAKSSTNKIAKLGSFLEKAEAPTAANLGSTAGSSLMVSKEKENPHTSPSRQVIHSLVGSGIGRHVAESPSTVKKLVHSLTHQPSLKEKDALPLKAIEHYKTKASDLYHRTVHPIEESLIKKGQKVSLAPVIDPLMEEKNKLHSYMAKRYFLKNTEEGKILEELLKHPKKVSFSEADKLQHMIRQRADKVGAFEVNKTETGRALASIDAHFRKALEDAVQEGEPESLKKYLRAKRMWTDKAKNKDPLIEDITKNRHLLGEPYKASFKKLSEGATHPRFILKNLKGEDKKAYAKEAIKHLGIKESLKSLKPKEALSWLGRNAHDLFLKRPEHRQVFYEALGIPNQSLAVRAVSKALPRPISVINASLETIKEPGREDKKLYQKISQLEEELGLPHRYAEGGKISSPVRQQLEEFLARRGRGGDTKIAEIGTRTAKFLDKAIHQGRKQINPRTGLREYNWECGSCHYEHNPDEVNECEVCYTARGHVPAQPHNSTRQSNPVMCKKSGCNNRAEIGHNDYCIEHAKEQQAHHHYVQQQEQEKLKEKPKQQQNRMLMHLVEQNNRREEMFKKKKKRIAELLNKEGQQIQQQQQWDELQKRQREYALKDKRKDNNYFSGEYKTRREAKEKNVPQYAPTYEYLTAQQKTSRDRERKAHLEDNALERNLAKHFVDPSIYTEDAQGNIRVGKAEIPNYRGFKQGDTGACSIATGLGGLNAYKGSLPEELEKLISDTEKGNLPDMEKNGNAIRAAINYFNNQNESKPKYKTTLQLFPEEGNPQMTVGKAMGLPTKMLGDDPNMRTTRKLKPRELYQEMKDNKLSMVGFGLNRKEPHSMVPTMMEKWINPNNKSFYRGKIYEPNFGEAEVENFKSNPIKVHGVNFPLHNASIHTIPREKK